MNDILAKLAMIYILCCTVVCAEVNLQYEQKECIPYDRGGGSIACICNSTYCDTLPRIMTLPDDTITIITSSAQRDRFKITNQPFKPSNQTAQVVFAVDTSQTFQTMIGFGGAITDAASINIIKNLDEQTRDQLMQTYYSDTGIEYTLGRVPIGSTDFSTHAYSYDDVSEDLSLSHFKLTDEDLNYKIPIIKQAQSLSKRGIRLFGSPWTAPAWMKTNDGFTGRGFLKGSAGGPYYKSYAQYLVKFLQSYKSENISFWGMTTQNEPVDGRIPGFKFQSMGFTAEMERDFIASDLGPALWSAGFKELQLMIVDDDIIFLPGFAKTVLDNATAAQYVRGVGVHWYANFEKDLYNLLTQTHNLKKNIFILGTEACSGYLPWETAVIIGSWDRAADYAQDIIKDIQNYAVGWTDWNIALNQSGGPNWVNNNVDSPIIVEQYGKSVFWKQPMFYAMGHFSKYITPGSIRINLKMSNTDLDGVAFSTPEKRIVLIVFNKNTDARSLQLTYNNSNTVVTIKERSINTLLWNY